MAHDVLLVPISPISLAENREWQMRMPTHARMFCFRRKASSEVLLSLISCLVNGIDVYRLQVPCRLLLSYTIGIGIW
jgi:hypothetical protein